MKTAAVVIDSWKLSIFKRRLAHAGYTFTEHPGLTPATLALTVEFEDVDQLTEVIRAAQLECAERKPQL